LRLHRGGEFCAAPGHLLSNRISALGRETEAQIEAPGWRPGRHLQLDAFSCARRFALECGENLGADAASANGGDERNIHEANDLGLVVAQQLADGTCHGVHDDPLGGVREGALISDAAGSILHLEQGAELGPGQTESGEVNRLFLREEPK